MAALLVAAAAASPATLDLAELREVQYSVTILDTPVAEGEEVEDLATSAVVMVNKEGQRYRCSVPRVEEKEAEEEGGREEEVVDVRALLQPLEDGPCIFKTKDWWTYEICYNRHEAPIVYRPDRRGTVPCKTLLHQARAAVPRGERQGGGACDGAGGAQQGAGAGGGDMWGCNPRGLVVSRVVSGFLPWSFAGRFGSK